MPGLGPANRIPTRRPWRSSKCVRALAELTQIHAERSRPSRVGCASVRLPEVEPRNPPFHDLTPVHPFQLSRPFRNNNQGTDLGTVFGASC